LSHLETAVSSVECKPPPNSAESDWSNSTQLSADLDKQPSASGKRMQADPPGRYTTEPPSWVAANCNRQLRRRSAVAASAAMQQNLASRLKRLSRPAAGGIARSEPFRTTVLRARPCVLIRADQPSAPPEPTAVGCRGPSVGSLQYDCSNFLIMIIAITRCLADR
jgi:hypothetical protein